MARTGTFAIGASMVLALAAGSALGQTTKSVAGSYTLVKNTVFGEKARGTMILAPDGQYSLIVASASLPKIASGARNKATAQENKAVVDGSIAHWGKYSVDDGGKNLTFHIQGSTFPNWDGQTQKRALKVSGDTLTYIVAAPSTGGAPNDVVWKRAK
jgi:hypothetical protein